MLRDTVNRLCAAFPGAERSDPWGGGHDAWKVGGKMFCVVGARDENGVNLKCPDIETAELLIDIGRAERAPYLHRSWVRVPPGRMAADELAPRLRIAYATIRAGLPKKLQATLAPLRRGQSRVRLTICGAERCGSPGPRPGPDQGAQRRRAAPDRPRRAEAAAPPMPREPLGGASPKTANLRRNGAHPRSGTALRCAGPRVGHGRDAAVVKPTDAPKAAPLRSAAVRDRVPPQARRRP